MIIQLFKKAKMVKKDYDVTVMQTPRFGQKKGYRQVYRLKVRASNHEEVVKEVYRRFNVSDLIPNDYEARFIGTGDIIFIDEARKGMTYYRLSLGGWSKINRVHVR